MGEVSEFSRLLNLAWGDVSYNTPQLALMQAASEEVRAED